MSTDINETTVQIDHTNGTVNFYTTKRSVFLQILKRNVNYTKVNEIQGGGYEVDYPISEIRQPCGLLKPTNESADDQFLTAEEKERRQKAGERLRQSRKALAAE